MQEFEKLTVVLFGPKVPRQAYLPRTIVVRAANGQEEEVWDLPSPVANAANVRADDFRRVEPPAGWKVVRAVGK